MDACLSKEELHDLFSGRLADLALTHAWQHLRDCGACRLRFNQLQSSAAATLVPTGDFSAQHAGANVLDATVVATDEMREAARHFPRIDGYHITGVLGQGGMGVVYKATQIKLNRTVALKVLPAVMGSASPAAVKRFRREATSAARLHHTNIIPIYDFGESRDAHYYAMEMVIGQPLSHLIRIFAEKSVGQASQTAMHTLLQTHVVDLPEARFAGMPREQSDYSAIGSTTAGRGKPYFDLVAKWMIDCADALYYAHGQGVIHRDIKPANLILSNDGRIMIADFGLAKTEDEDSVTAAGAFLGTLRYSSPEQASPGKLPIDHRTDIFSLGATMYELLCFHPAFPGSDEKTVLSAVLSRDPMPPRRLNPSVPAELETICLKALEKDPAHRYASGRELADDIRRYSNDLPIVAKRPSVFARAIKFSRRHKAMVTGVAAAILLSASGLMFVREQSRRREANMITLCEQGISLAQNRNWDNARRKLDEAQRINPDHIKPLLTLTWMELERVKHLKEEEKASVLASIDQLCRRILEREPDNIAALNYHAVAMRRLARHDQAIDSLKKVVQLQPDYFAAWTNLGTSYAMKGDMEAAEKCLLKGAQLASQGGTERLADRAHVWRNLGAFALIQASPQAAEYLEKAVTWNSSDVASWVLIVKMRLTLPGFVAPQEALDDAKHADRLANQKNPRAKRLRALAHLANHEFAEAVIQARSALALQDFPTINHLIIALGEAQLQRGEEASLALGAAQDSWPASFSTAGQIRVSGDDGILWFERADELLELRKDAEKAFARLRS